MCVRQKVEYFLVINRYLKIGSRHLYKTNYNFNNELLYEMYLIEFYL